VESSGQTVPARRHEELKRNAAKKTPRQEITERETSHPTDEEKGQNTQFSRKGGNEIVQEKWPIGFVSKANRRRKRKGIGNRHKNAPLLSKEYSTPTASWT